MGFKELIEKLKLKAGQIISQKWFENLYDTLKSIDNDINVGGRLSFRKLPDGEYGKVLIAQGIGKDPVYADPDCNIVKIAGTAVTPRDWSLDFQMLQNIDVKISTRASEATLADVRSKAIETVSKLDSIISRLNYLDVYLSSRASETTLQSIKNVLPSTLSERGNFKIAVSEDVVGIARETTLTATKTKIEECATKLSDVISKLESSISVNNEIKSRIEECIVRLNEIISNLESSLNIEIALSSKIDNCIVKLDNIVSKLEDFLNVKTTSSLKTIISTQNLLEANEEFVSDVVDAFGTYPIARHIYVSCFSDANGQLFIEYSPDAIDWLCNDSFDYIANTPLCVDSLKVKSRYVRVRYKNFDQDQNVFKLFAFFIT